MLVKSCFVNKIYEFLNCEVFCLGNRGFGLEKVFSFVDNGFFFVLICFLSLFLKNLYFFFFKNVILSFGCFEEFWR